MDWLRKLWRIISQLLGAILHFVVNAFTHYDQVVDDINAIMTRYAHAKETIQKEIAELRKFQFNPAWKTRVINVPAAIERTQELQARILDDFQNRLRQIVEPVHELTLILKQESAPNPGDPTGAVSALSKTEAKLGEVVVMIHQVRIAFDSVTEFVDLFSELRKDVETLDVIFLQQKNPRKWSTEHLRKRVS